jgi:hypothetical protein
VPLRRLTHLFILCTVGSRPYARGRFVLVRNITKAAFEKKFHWSVSLIDLHENDDSHTCTTWVSFERGSRPSDTCLWAEISSISSVALSDSVFEDMLSLSLGLFVLVGLVRGDDAGEAINGEGRAGGYISVWTRSCFCRFLGITGVTNDRTVRPVGTATIMLQAVHSPNVMMRYGGLLPYWGTRDWARLKANGSTEFVLDIEVLLLLLLSTRSSGYMLLSMSERNDRYGNA